MAQSTRPKILAVDLDGTLLKDDHPTLGKPIPEVVAVLRDVRAAGWKITVWTVRDEDTEVRKHLKDADVPFDYINENPFGPPNGSRKIYADVYLDNHAIQFNGETRGLAEEIINFKSWDKRNPVSGQ
jgi:hydroxymethylpyrimidine pyrophosphatase-like HAD family hydrolase